MPKSPLSPSHYCLWTTKEPHENGYSNGTNASANGSSAAANGTSEHSVKPEPPSLEELLAAKRAEEESKRDFAVGKNKVYTYQWLAANSRVADRLRVRYLRLHLRHSCW